MTIMIASSDIDLINAFNKASGKDLTSFFESWLEGRVSVVEMAG